MATALAPSQSGNVAGVPWPDLPDDLAEKILERLPIFDYIRFGAVCRRWRSIQEAHRLHHAPAHPPVASLPCFIPARPNQEDVPCSFGLSSGRRSRRSIHVPFSPSYLEYLHSKKEEEAAVGRRDWRAPCPTSVSLPYGWLLFDDRPLLRYPRGYKFTLLNPITGAQIPLPYLETPYDYVMHDSKATMSPPPQCDVILLTTGARGIDVHLYRPGNPQWTRVVYSRNAYSDDLSDLSIVSAIHYKGKFYCLFLGRGLMVVDADQDDGVSGRFFEMDQSLLPKVGLLEGDATEIWLELFLVESNGRMLLLSYYFKYLPSFTYRIFVRFELCEADLSNRRWVKVESLGDQSLFIYRNFVVSLPAADVGVKENCIYILDPPTDEPTPCSVFDFGTGVVDDTPIACPTLPSTHLMFMPSIY